MLRVVGVAGGVSQVLLAEAAGVLEAYGDLDQKFRADRKKVQSQGKYKLKRWSSALESRSFPRGAAKAWGNWAMEHENQRENNIITEEVVLNQFVMDKVCFFERETLGEKASKVCCNMPFSLLQSFAEHGARGYVIVSAS
jgi:hypothetical protein